MVQMIFLSEIQIKCFAVWRISKVVLYCQSGTYPLKASYFQNVTLKSNLQTKILKKDCIDKITDFLGKLKNETLLVKCKPEIY